MVRTASGSLPSKPAVSRETLPENFPGRNDIVAGLQRAALLNQTATLADVGNVAAFVASDQARTITASDANISAGAIMD